MGAVYVCPPVNLASPRFVFTIIKSQFGLTRPNARPSLWSARMFHANLPCDFPDG